MPRNSFVQMSKLHNVRGRIYYISSDKNRKISMRYMKPQTENFGQNLPSAIRQNLRKAVQRKMYRSKRIYHCPAGILCGLSARRTIKIYDG